MSPKTENLHDPLVSSDIEEEHMLITAFRRVKDRKHGDLPGLSGEWKIGQGVGGCETYLRPHPLREVD